MNNYKPSIEWTGRYIRWESVFEFVDAMCRDGMKKPNCDANQCSAKRTGYTNLEWINHYTPEVIRETIQDGSYPYNSIVSDMVDEIESDVEIEAEMTRKVFHRQEFGEELDPMSVATRNPDGWSEVRRVRKQKPVVRVLINSAVLHNKTSSHLLYRGAAAAALTDFLETQGYAVELLFATFSARTQVGDIKSITSEQVMLKHANMPLDMEAVTIACCEVGFFRSICLRCRVMCFDKRVAPGFGRTVKVPKLVADQFDFVLDSDLLSKQDAINYLKAVKATAEIEA